MSSVGVFNAENPRYKCCCSSCYATTGVKIVVVLMLVSVFMSLFGSIAKAGGGGAGGGGFGFVVTLICAGCACYALYAKKHLFLLPQMVVQCISIVLCVIGGVAFLILGLVGAQVLQDFMEGEAGEHREHVEGMAGGAAAFGIIMAVILFVVAALEVWFFTVFLAAYRFFKEKASYTGGTPMTAVPTQYYQPAQAQPPAYTKQ